MYLVRTELMKIFSRKSIWIITGITMLLLLITYHSGNGEIILEKSIQSAVYEGVEGPVTVDKAEKLNMIINNPNKSHTKDNSSSEPISRRISTAQCIKLETPRIEYVLNYPDTIKSKISNLEQEKSSLSKDSYEYRKLIKLTSMLRNVKSPQIYMDRGWILALGNLQKEFFIIFLILLGVSPVFSSEYSNHADAMILTCKYGKSRVVSAKITATYIFIISMYVFMTAFNLVNLSYAHLLRGLNNSIQSVTAFSWYNSATFTDSPYPLTIFQYIIYFSAVKFFACLAIGSLAIFISSRCRSSLSAFLITLGIVYIPALAGIFQESKLLLLISDFSYKSLLAPAPFFKTYKVYNVLGFPVLHLDALIVLYTMITALLVYLTYRSFRNHQVC